MNIPYIMQFYDVQMDDGDVMKGNIVRSAKFSGDWQVSKTGTSYEIVLRKACESYKKTNLLFNYFKYNITLFYNITLTNTTFKQIFYSL